MERSNGILANSRAILVKVTSAYGVQLAEARCGVVPHGIDDLMRLPARPRPPLAPGQVRLLFVGRIEPRKGVDVLLNAIGPLFARHPHLHLDLVGDDSIVDATGSTLRAVFEADPAMRPLYDRVIFHGSVDDEILYGFYAGCDIVVAPSRFESFGLVLLEGMAFAKPVIGCRTGGMMEVVQDGVSGLLAEPGNTASLEACLERLVSDRALRLQLGACGRVRYESCFTSSRMAEGVLRFVDHLIANRNGLVEQRNG
jgi:glycosyltransferase involved in cell wall biosynthesis